MKTNDDLILPAGATLADFQKYESDMEKVRGFDQQPVLEKFLLLSEEVGELSKAIRKLQGIKIDQNSQVGKIPEELADIFIMTLSIANKLEIDLEEAFREKEEVNKQRNWS